MNSVRRREAPWKVLVACGLSSVQAACLAPFSSGGLRGQVEEIRRQLAQIESQQKSNREAIRALEPAPPPSTPGRIEATGTPAAAGPPPETPRGPGGGEAVYREGYALLHRGHPEAAELALRSFVQAHPASPLADNARYWIGESLFERRRYARALGEFRAVIEQYPAGDETAAALYKIALCELELGQQARARAALQEILERHPESDVAPLARERLQAP